MVKRTIRFIILIRKQQKGSDILLEMGYESGCLKVISNDFDANYQNIIEDWLKEETELSSVFFLLKLSYSSRNKRLEEETKNEKTGRKIEPSSESLLQWAGKSINGQRI